MNVYKIANLATVWALVEVFEHQIQHLRVGQRVRLTVEAFPGRTWRGAVIRLNPELDTRTRTLGAQVEVSESRVEGCDRGCTPTSRLKSLESPERS